MNPAQKQKYMIGLVVLLCIFGIFFSIYSYNTTTVVKEIQNKNTGEITKVEEQSSAYLWTAFFLAVILIVFLVRFSRIEVPTTMVRFEQGISDYREYMRKHHDISIPDNYEIYWTDADNDDWYKTILQVPNHTEGGFLYYPIEINKFWQMDDKGEPFILFGEGQGVETDNINRVNIFKLKKKKSSQHMMESKVKDLIIEHLHGGGEK